MAATPEMIEIACPHCGEEFAGWDRPAPDLPNGAVCPHCGFNLAHDPRIREEGLWYLTTDEEAAER